MALALALAPAVGYAAAGILANDPAAGRLAGPTPDPGPSPRDDRRASPACPGWLDADGRPHGALGLGMPAQVLPATCGRVGGQIGERLDFGGSRFAAYRASAGANLGLGLGLELAASLALGQQMHVGSLALVDQAVDLRWAPFAWTADQLNPSLRLRLLRRALSPAQAQLGLGLGGALGAFGQWQGHLNLGRDLRGVAAEQAYDLALAAWFWPSGWRLGLGVEGRLWASDRRGGRGQWQQAGVAGGPLLVWAPWPGALLDLRLPLGQMAQRLGDARVRARWFWPTAQAQVIF